MNALPHERPHCFPADPRSVGLLLTYRCTAACDDCCFECSPRRREMLPLAAALEAIDQLSEIDSVEGITISGGECFLRHGDLRRVLEHARARGLKTKLVSNGYWALSCEVATRKLRPLVEAGLSIIELSTDDYHARYIPLSRVANALEAAHGLGLETHVIVVTDRQARSLAEILAEMELSFEPTVAKEFPVLPIGAARRRIPKGRLRTRPLPDGRCHEILRRPAISPEGKVFACCGVAGFTPQLKIGEIDGTPLAQLFEAARDEVLHMILSLDGPKGLAVIAAQRGVFDLEREFVDECHLCHELLTDEKVVAVLRQELERNRFSYLLRRDYAEHLMSRAPAPQDDAGAGNGKEDGKTDALPPRVSLDRPTHAP